MKGGTYRAEIDASTASTPAKRRVITIGPGQARLSWVIASVYVLAGGVAAAESEEVKSKQVEPDNVQRRSASPGGQASAAVLPRDLRLAMTAPHRLHTSTIRRRSVGDSRRPASQPALSQRQLSFPGCSAAYISRLEAGDRVPRSSSCASWR